MTSRSIARFTIEVNGIPRALLSLGLGKHGDVFLHLHAAEFATESGTLLTNKSQAVHHGERITDQRYSIHPSSGSKEFNTIKQTIKLSSGRLISTSHVTDAIRQQTFAAIFARRSPDLSLERYIPRRDAKTNVSLGSFDPKEFTLVQLVIVGSSRKPFTLAAPGNINVKQLVLGEFRIVILWSFLNIPAHSSGNLVHMMTVRPERVPEGFRDGARSLMKGKSARTFVTFFKSLQTQILDEFIQIIRQSVGAQIAFEARAFAGYFRRPDPKSRKLEKHIISARQKRFHK